MNMKRMKHKLKIWAAILVPPTAAIITLLVFPATRECGVFLLIVALIVGGVVSFSWGISQMELI